MLQQRQTIKNYTEAPLRDIQFATPVPPADDNDVLPIDSKYFTYFVSQVPEILDCSHYFPNVISTVFTKSVEQPVLRHSILAMSSWMADNRQGQLPLYTLRHLERILPTIQKAIVDLDINDSHILSVSFLSWLSLMMGDLHTTHRHLKGLFLMFLQTRQLNLQGQPMSNPDPTMMFFYRMSIKIDNTLAYRNFSQAYPPLQTNETLHRQWLQHYISNQNDVEACLAAFKLDDLTNQICHVHHQVRQLRKQNRANVDSEIQSRAELLAREHTDWLQNPIVRPHIPTDEGYPTLLNQSSNENSIRFLHYPAYRISNANFSQMILIHSSLAIHLSILITGKLGPYPHARYENAVQVCRVYASLGTLRNIMKSGQSTIINALWLAGLVLGNDCYPAGTFLNLSSDKQHINGS
jgi:hypothetical protein